jgi:hypothetical protein
MLRAGTNVGQSSDPALAEAQGADARLAIISGGWYLRDHLNAATPPELASAIKGLTQVMLDLGANYLADARNDDPAQSALIKVRELGVRSCAGALQVRSASGNTDPWFMAMVGQ